MNNFDNVYIAATPEGMVLDGSLIRPNKKMMESAVAHTVVDDILVSDTVWDKLGTDDERQLMLNALVYEAPVLRGQFDDGSEGAFDCDMYWESPWSHHGADLWVDFRVYPNGSILTVFFPSER